MAANMRELIYVNEMLVLGQTERELKHNLNVYSSKQIKNNKIGITKTMLTSREIKKQRTTNGWMA